MMTETLKKYSFKDVATVVSILVVVGSLSFFFGHLANATDNLMVQQAEMKGAFSEMNNNYEKLAHGQRRLGDKVDKLYNLLSNKKQLKLQENIDDEYE